LFSQRLHLQKLISLFQSAVIKYEKIASATPIQVVVIPGNEEVKTAAGQLQQNNLDVRAILYPTVPKNRERLRIVLHAFNTVGEIEKLISLLQ
jgi:8-amino-7-oxononanoate synthase